MLRPMCLALMVVGGFAGSDAQAVDRVDLIDPQGHRFDVWKGTGAFWLGYLTYDDYGFLCVHSEDAGLPPSPATCRAENRFDSGTILQVGNSAELGTDTLLDGALEVERTVFVPEEGDWGFARFLQRLTNVSASPVRFVVRFTGRLDADEDLWVTATSHDARIGAQMEPGLHWVGTDDWGHGGGGAALAHIFSSPGAPVPVQSVRLEEDVLEAGWTITLDPGESKYLLNFETQQDYPAQANAVAEWLITSPAEALVGLDADVLDNLVNWYVGPPKLALSQAGTASPGGYVEWTLSLTEGALTPGASAWLVEADSAGAGPCPAYLDGACWGVVAPRVRSHALVGLDGKARFGERLSTDLTPGTRRALQAASPGFPPSNVLILEVGP
jgi:hypothetical protein